MHIKSFTVWKLSSLLILVSLLIAACPSPLINSYYVQQQNRVTDNGNNDGGNNGNNEEPGGDVPVTPEEPAEPGKISMFSVILPDGKLAEPNSDTTVHNQLASKLNASDGFPFGTFATAKFIDWKFSSNFSASNVPEPKYSGTVTWESAPENKNPEREKYGGKESAKAGSNSISSMTYYRYCGKNPFNLYTSETYDVYGEDGKPTGQKEALMKRFIFYRFTGTAIVVGLDNYLVAIDTYTKLVFSFAKPVDFKSVAGNKVPTKWASVDTHSAGPGGNKYRFYQYDPIGYVTEDGTFHLNDTYKGNLASGNYDPAFTGKSPYLGYANGTQEEEQEPPLNGTLTVKTKYLKNINVTDGWEGEAEFIWDIRFRAYSGDKPPLWTSLTKQDSEWKLPKQKSVTFGASPKQYEFNGHKGPHMLELDSKITEPDWGNSDDPVTEYEKPIIYFKYDAESKVWKPNGTNEKFVYGTVSFDKNFTLADGEVKEFVIILPAEKEKKDKKGKDITEKMELCYELSWKAE